ncbi:MAG: S9 family peptidase [Acidobacteria bacterium]|nr:S9 family peptidase [Acidobacteriota bacterium]
MRRSVFVAASFIAFVVASTAAPTAQNKPTLAPADYDQFESAAPGAPRGGLSPDGKWLAYGITRVGGDNELRIIPATGANASDTARMVAFGTGASFTSNSEWLAYGIGQSEAEQERLRTARQPIQRKLGLLNLGTRTETIIDGIETFAFDRTGQSIAMKRYAPAPPAGATGGAPATAPAPPAGGRGGAPAAPATAIGTTLLVRDLKTGTTTTFGNVSEYTWQPSDIGHLLAMVISAEGQAGNGIHLYNPATSVLKALDASVADYSGLTWRNDSADLVALKSRTNEKYDGPTQAVLAWTSLGQSNEKVLTLDPTAGALPMSKRLVTFRRPSWLEVGANDGAMILLGVADWTPRPPAPEGSRGGRGAAATPEKADVDVWHWNDTTVMSAQKLSVAADRRRNLPAVWNLATGQLVVVGKTFDEQITPIRGTRLAVVSEFTPYLMDRSIGRPASDVQLVDLTTGTRTPLKTRATSSPQVSPTGKYAIYSEGGHYWTINLTTKAVTNITKGAKTSFVDVDSDSTAPEKPMFGVAGWTKDDASVVLNDAFNLWNVSPDGQTATRLTSGAASQVRHRFLRVDAVGFGAPSEPVDLESGFLSLFGTRTKKSGYGRFPSGADGAVTQLVWLDKSVTGLAKAEKADVFSYTVQGSDDSPDIFVGGADLAKATQVTTTNPFLSTYAWGRTELVTYDVQPKGQPKMTLQGSLYYPANYEPGKKYPMVVYLYEKLSDGLHQFSNPSERSYYNGTALTQQGYFYFQPDIVFQPREPGVSVVECVTAAVKTVVDMGVVDAGKIGVMGHSWGGFDAMYLATHSKIFAAAVSGAGISNLISNYGNGHWSSGIAETDHIETGQQRMVVPLYEDLQAYIRNSAVFGISTMTTPLLLMTGDNDGTVYWHQSVELYNIARRAKKNVVMLVYNNEDHGLRVKKNQVDYHRRIGAWFAHYLKGEPAPTWITAGVPATAR